MLTWFEPLNNAQFGIQINLLNLRIDQDDATFGGGPLKTMMARPSMTGLGQRNYL